ncbi:MAG: patatin-like phospholipase family protein [Deltaproteobacteria bacterium]|nr:patatin-like phospholipase family protein [Deltaproteobacteria bacterium]
MSLFQQPASVAFLLTGGGARTAYQLGVLKYIFSELRIHPESPIFVGTSAGAINCYHMTFKAHEGWDIAIERLCDVWTNLTVDHVYRTDPWHILKGAGNFLFNFTVGRFIRKRHVESLLDTTPLYLLLRKHAQEDHYHLHENIQKGIVRALGVTAMQYGTGKTITFFEDSPHSGIPEWQRGRREGKRTRLRLKHVMASAAIPLIFPSVKLENCYYGDGSIRMSAPLSSAIALGATKIFTINLNRGSMAELKPIETYPSISQIGGMLYNTIFLDSLDFDLRILNRMNDMIDRMPSVDPALRKVESFIMRPSQDLGLLALPFRKNIPSALQFLVKGLGPTDRSGADFLSYILFSGDYIRALIDIGYRDAEKRKQEILNFFSTG